MKVSCERASLEISAPVALQLCVRSFFLRIEVNVYAGERLTRRRHHRSAAEQK
jgi:hypothetical protein